MSAIIQIRLKKINLEAKSQAQKWQLSQIVQTIRKTQHDPLNHKQTQDRRKWQFQIPHYDIRLEQRKLQGHSGKENVGQVAESTLANGGQTVSP